MWIGPCSVVAALDGVLGVAARPGSRVGREPPWPSGGVVVVVTTSGWGWKPAKVVGRNVFGGRGRQGRYRGGDAPPARSPIAARWRTRPMCAARWRRRFEVTLR